MVDWLNGSILLIGRDFKGQSRGFKIMIIMDKKQYKLVYKINVQRRLIQSQ